MMYIKYFNTEESDAFCFQRSDVVLKESSSMLFSNLLPEWGSQITQTGDGVALSQPSPKLKLQLLSQSVPAVVVASEMHGTFL